MTVLEIPGHEMVCTQRNSITVPESHMGETYECKELVEEEKFRETKPPTTAMTFSKNTTLRSVKASQWSQTRGPSSDRRTPSTLPEIRNQEDFMKRMFLVTETVPHKH